MRTYADPAAPSINEKPAVTVRADRADEKITVIKPRAAHHERIETPALLGVHRGIDPQRSCRAFASHAATLSKPTDTDWARRVLAWRAHQLIVGARRRVERRAGRT